MGLRSPLVHLHLGRACTESSSLSKTISRTINNHKQYSEASFRSYHLRSSSCILSRHSFSIPTVSVPECCPGSQYLNLAQQPVDGWNHKIFRNAGNEPNPHCTTTQKNKDLIILFAFWRHYLTLPKDVVYSSPTITWLSYNKIRCSKHYYSCEKSKCLFLWST